MLIKIKLSSIDQEIEVIDLNNIDFNILIKKLIFRIIVKNEDNNKENIEKNVNKLVGYYSKFYETQMIQLETQLKFFYYLNQTTFNFN
jgi:hypothetical protein